MIGLNGLDSSTQVSALLPGTFVLLLLALLAFVNIAPNTWQIKLLGPAKTVVHYRKGFDSWLKGFKPE